MGQYWRFVDIDGHVMTDLCPMKLGEGIWDLRLHHALRSGGLRRMLPLDKALRSLSDYETGPLPPPRNQKQSRLLSVLPMAVLRLVFESLGPPDVFDMSAGIDAVAFALTCQLCLEVGYPVLKKHQAAKKQAFVGHRLIIVGDYQDGNDLPDGLDVDGPAWREPKKNIYTETEDWPENYSDLFSAVTASRLFNKMDKEASTWQEGRAVRTLENLWWSMFFVPKQPRIANPVLRNLNTKEYAREDVLVKEQQDGDNGPQFNDLYIGDLALFRICWSSKNDVAMYAPKIYRGPWAGHRFDVVDFSPVDLEGWKDVSEELIAEVAEIYAAEFGRASTRLPFGLLSYY